MAKARFEIYEDAGWRWQLIDGNGEPVANRRMRAYAEGRPLHLSRS